jgi:hypothetical protein
MSAAPAPDVSATDISATHTAAFANNAFMIDSPRSQKNPLNEQFLSGAHPICVRHSNDPGAPDAFAHQLLRFSNKCDQLYSLTILLTASAAAKTPRKSQVRERSSFEKVRRVERFATLIV